MTPHDVPPHQRYLDVFRFLQSRDEELAHAFDGPRRSRMIVQLAAIHAYRLVEPANSNASRSALARRLSGSPRSSRIPSRVDLSEQAKADGALRVTAVSATATWK